MVVEEIDIENLVFDHGVLPNKAIKLAVVLQFATDLRNGAKFPPIQIVSDGSKYWLCDGASRVAAYQKVGKKTISACIMIGTYMNAIELTDKLNKPIAV